MLSFKESLKKLQNSKEFKDYMKKNPDAYIANTIYLDTIEFNLFSPKTKIVTVFSVENNITSKELDKENRIFPRLDLKKIKLDVDEIMKIFENERLKICKDEVTKTIIILQQDKEPVWNLSQLTSSIKILQILISAETGKVIESSYKRIIEKA